MTEPATQSVGPLAYYVLLSHNCAYDRAALHLLFPYPVRYICLLGPRRKVARLLDELGLAEAERAAPV